MRDDNFPEVANVIPEIVPRIVPLTPELIPHLKFLEDATELPFWGDDSYRRFLEKFWEYFGFCLITDDSDGKHTAGFTLARTVYEDLELLKIGVAPEFQRAGLGTRLLDETLTEGKRRNCERCFLEVRKSNQKAIQFYLAHGFLATGTRPRYYSNPVEDALIMERQIFSLRL